jgi:hypothetical protein
MNEDLEQQKTSLEMEREELNTLVQRGFKFTVHIRMRQRAKGLPGFFGKKELVEKAFPFEIKQPTLATLDRISEVVLDIAASEETPDGNTQEVLAIAWRQAREHSRKLARVIAIATLGEDYYRYEISMSGETLRQECNDKELDRLTDMFFHTVTPSELVVLASAITSTANLSDFIVSTRYLSGTRTAQQRKDRVELPD